MKTRIKRFNRIYVFVVFAILTLYASTVFSAVPEIINYQGSLSDDVGNPVNATLNITFTLYDAEVAGSNLWQEVQPVTVTNGQFSAQFGADGGNPLDPSLFENPIFLGVQVDADAEMTPRQPITAVGYAFRSKTVENDTLNSLSCAANEIPKFNGSVWVCAADDSNTDTNAATICIPGTFLNGDGSCDTITDTNTNAATLCPAGTYLNGDGTCEPATHIATGAVGSSEVQDNSLTGSDIADGSVGQDDLSINSVGSSEIASDAVGLSELSDLAKGLGVGGTIVVPGSAFQPAIHSYDYIINFSSIRPFSTFQALCLSAPVALPDGVTVTHFEISVWDDSVTSNVGAFTLWRKSFSTGANVEMGTVSSSGASASVRVFADTTIFNAIVSGLSYSYFISGCFTADADSPLNTRLNGARIRYN